MQFQDALIYFGAIVTLLWSGIQYLAFGQPIYETVWSPFLMTAVLAVFLGLVIATLAIVLTAPPSDKLAAKTLSKWTVVGICIGGVFYTLYAPGGMALLSLLLIGAFASPVVIVVDRYYRDNLPNRPISDRVESMLMAPVEAFGIYVLVTLPFGLLYVLGMAFDQMPISPDNAASNAADSSLPDFILTLGSYLIAPVYRPLVGDLLVGLMTIVVIVAGIAFLFVATTQEERIDDETVRVSTLFGEKVVNRPVEDDE